MDPRLLLRYSEEVAHLREMGREFAERFPGIAPELGLSTGDVRDPHVERLIESAAFLAARVRLKLDAEFPRFTSRMLEAIYPGWLAPVPSMAIVQFSPRAADGDRGGPNLPRGTRLRAGADRGFGDRSAVCEYRTAHDVDVSPLEVVGISYMSQREAGAANRRTCVRPVRAGIRLVLRTTGGPAFVDRRHRRLRFHLGGADDRSCRLFDTLVRGTAGIAVGVGGAQAGLCESLPASTLRPVGFSDDEALLPVSARLFQGHRLLQEYFAFPQRFLFFDLDLTDARTATDAGATLEVAILLDRDDPEVERSLDRDAFLLNCVPAINLFPHRAERLQVSRSEALHHVVPDRLRPLDYEIYDVVGVTGFGQHAGPGFEIPPLFEARNDDAVPAKAWFVTDREPRLAPAVPGRVSGRTDYVGSEVFLSLVDSRDAPWRGELGQLSIRTRCTNRDLPLLLRDGGTVRFEVEGDLAACAVRCVRGPTVPRSALRETDAPWHLLNQLSANYMAVLGEGEGPAVDALRRMLRLHVGADDAAAFRQIEGLRSLRARSVMRRLPGIRPASFARGLDLTLSVDDAAFQGGSAVLLGCVLDHVFARQVMLNAITQLTLESVQQGTLHRWSPRSGLRPAL